MTIMDTETTYLVENDKVGVEADHERTGAAVLTHGVRGLDGAHLHGLLRVKVRRCNVHTAI